MRNHHDDDDDDNDDDDDDDGDDDDDVDDDDDDGDDDDNQLVQKGGKVDLRTKVGEKPLTRVNFTISLFCSPCVVSRVC